MGGVAVAVCTLGIVETEGFGDEEHSVVGALGDRHGDITTGASVTSRKNSSLTSSGQSSPFQWK